MSNLMQNLTTLPPTEQPLLRVRGLCKYFPIRSRGLIPRHTGVVKAVDDLSFDLARGQTLGLVGESGCGKTTAGRTLLRALKPSGGEAWFQSSTGTVDLTRLPARALKPLRREMQMIFQDPFSSLNPRMTIGDIVGEPLRIHGLAQGNALRNKVAQMLIRVGLKPEHSVRYPHAFSGGQRQRVGIARALVMNPSLIVADEAVSALDVSVQAQVINLLEDLQRDFNLALIFIAHDLSVVRHISQRIAVMYAGRVVELADTESLFQMPEHPYTHALLSAVPVPDPDHPVRSEITGEAADPAHLPSGCSFHPRCPRAIERCRHERPALRTVRGRQVACHLCQEPAATPRR